MKLNFFFRLTLTLTTSLDLTPSEATTRGVLYKKLLLEISQNSPHEACNFIKKETLAQVKNTFFTERVWTTASTPSMDEYF